MALLRRFLMAAAVGAALFAPTVASAALADVTGAVNMRTGPGVGYPIIQVLPAGARVDSYCAGGTFWCQVTYGGVTGWVSSSYLAHVGFLAPPPVFQPVPPPVYYGPPSYVFPLPNFYPRPVYPSGVYVPPHCAYPPTYYWPIG